MSSRRGFLAAAGGAMLVGLPACAPPQDHSEHSPGPVETSGGHGPMSGVHGPTFRSGGRVDHAANGFDPRILLRDFDYGHTSIGADGRMVREWEVIAEDREIEVAPGLRFGAWTFNGWTDAAMH